VADTDELIVQVLPVVDSDTEELADLAGRLLAELLGVGEAPLIAKAAPEGAKGLGDLAGRLLVRFGTPDGLRAVMAAVRGWTSRTGRTVEVSIGGDVLKVTGVTSQQQREIIDAWLAHHAERIPDADVRVAERIPDADVRVAEAAGAAAAGAGVAGAGVAGAGVAEAGRSKRSRWPRWRRPRSRRPRSRPGDVLGGDSAGARGDGHGGGRGGDDGWVPPARPHYLVGQCPESVTVGMPFNLLASINVAAGPTSAELEHFDVPSEGQDVVLVIYAPGLRVLSDHQQTVHVPADADSRPVRFRLRADTPGPAKVSITAWIGGTHLGELRVEITAERVVAPQGPDREVHAEITIQPTAGP